LPWLFELYVVPPPEWGVPAVQTPASVPELVPEVVPELAPELEPELAPIVDPELVPELPPALDPEDVIPELAPALDPELVPELVPVVDPELVPEVTPVLDPDVVPELSPELDPEVTPEDAPELPWLLEDGPPVLDGELHAPTSAATPTNEIRRAIIPAPAPSHPSQWIEKLASFHAPPSGLGDCSPSKIFLAPGRPAPPVA
jgi:hypothetical protein